MDSCRSFCDSVKKLVVVSKFDFSKPNQSNNKTKKTMDYKKLYEQTLAENKELKKKNDEQKLTIDCHLAELEFTNASALDEPREYNDWLKSHYDEERYKQIYDWINLSEYFDEEEDEDQ